MHQSKRNSNRSSDSEMLTVYIYKCVSTNGAKRSQQFKKLSAPKEISFSHSPIPLSSWRSRRVIGCDECRHVGIGPKKAKERPSFPNNCAASAIYKLNAVNLRWMCVQKSVNGSIIVFFFVGRSVLYSTPNFQSKRAGVRFSTCVCVTPRRSCFVCIYVHNTLSAAVRASTETRKDGNANDEPAPTFRLIEEPLWWTAISVCCVCEKTKCWSYPSWLSAYT